MTRVIELPPLPEPVASFTEIQAASARAQARSLAAGVPPVLRLSLLQSRRWACVALEDELEGEAAARLAHACSAAGFQSGWAAEVPWTAGERVPDICRFDVSTRAFQTVSKTLYIGSCFVMSEAGGGFALASDGDLYWMVAGPAAFVERAAALPIDEAVARFGAFAANYASTTLPGSILRTVHATVVAASAAAYV